jgi:hypothetical protein
MQAQPFVHFHLKEEGSVHGLLPLPYDAVEFTVHLVRWQDPRDPGLGKFGSRLKRRVVCLRRLGV